jgi:hypothetical protein
MQSSAFAGKQKTGNHPAGIRVKQNIFSVDGNLHEILSIG